MSEASMIETVQKALGDLGITDELVAVGQFEPRGHVGALFAGGLIGGEVGGALGQAGDAIGTGVGAIAGAHAHDAGSGLPREMLLGVSDSTVYGFAARSRRDATDLVFRIERSALTVKVHQRANVRILELADAASGSTIELEGNRLPITHSKDVIQHLE